MTKSFFNNSKQKVIQQLVAQDNIRREMLKKSDANIPYIAKLLTQNSREYISLLEQHSKAVRQSERYSFPLNKKYIQGSPEMHKYLKSHTVTDPITVSFFKKYNSKINWMENYSAQENLVTKYWLDPSGEIMIDEEEVGIAGDLSNRIKNIEFDEMAAFYTHLMQFPLLGLLHETGKKIFDWTKNANLKTVNELTLFRARANEFEDTPPFIFEELFTAPYGITGFGRFNFIGHNFLYLCETEDIAKREAAGSSEINFGFGILKVKLTREVQLLDLTSLEGSSIHDHSHFPMRSNQRKEYLLPNFIAYCAKYNNIDGIKYSSTKDDDSANYVLFNATHEWFECL